MFEKYYWAKDVERILVSQENYAPFPKSGEGLTLQQKQAAIAAGEQYLQYTWPISTAADYMSFYTKGNRTVFERGAYAARRQALLTLADAELAQGEGRFITDIINGLWAIMDEATWVVPAHLGHELPDVNDAPVVDIFAAGTSGLLSAVCYLFADRINAVSPLILERYKKLLDERIIEPFMTQFFFWSGLTPWYDGRMFTNNWNPWIISNVLLDVGVMVPSQKKRAAVIARALFILDRFVASYPSDGGCDEGPSYWGAAGAALFDCLQELSGLIGGAFNCYFYEPLIQNIAMYICRAHIGKNFFTNYADAPLKTFPDADTVFRFGKATGQADMAAMGKALYLLKKKEHIEDNPMAGVHHCFKHFQALFGAKALEDAPQAEFPLFESVFLDGLEMIALRERQGTQKGLYLSAKGGHNAENHNHNDVGSFIIYADSQPVIVDIGSGTYSAKTFGKHRYENAQMQSNYHNLPVINGCGQLEGRQYCAKEVKYEKCADASAVFSMDISSAYGVDAGVSRWKRTFIYNRTAQNIVIDEQAAFTQQHNAVDFVFMVPVEPEICGKEIVVSAHNAPKVRICFEQGHARWEVLDISEDEGLRKGWGDKLYRVLVHVDCEQTLHQQFTVLLA